MKRFWLPVMLLATAPVVLNAEDSLSDNQGQPIVVTERDVEQGLRNVRNVVADLQALMMPNTAIEALKRNMADAKPYLKIIDGTQLNNVDKNSTLIYKCRYNRAEWLSTPLEAIISTYGSVERNDEQNMLIISDRAEKMPELEKAVLSMDIPSPQILVEARIVEFLINDGMERNLSATMTRYDKAPEGSGLDFIESTGGMDNPILGTAAPGQGLGANWTPYVSDNQSMNVTFQWLMTAQNAKLLTSPNLTISRNEVATITTAQDIPIQNSTNSGGTIQISTEFKRVGVQLEIEPRIINENSVTLRINPEVSNVASYQTLLQGNVQTRVPVITVRSLETELALENGQTIILGGLYDSRDIVLQERTPFLSDLPFVGEMFTSKNVSTELTQLIFFLRVHVLTTDEILTGITYDPVKVAGDSQELGRIFEDSAIIPTQETTLEKVNKEFIEEPEIMRQKREQAVGEQK